MSIDDFLAYIKGLPKDTIIKVKTGVDKNTFKNIFENPILTYNEEEGIIYMY